MKRFPAILSIILCVVLLLAGCSSGTPQAANTQAQQSGGSARTPKDIYADEIKIGFICDNLTTPVGVAWNTGVQLGLQLDLYPNIKYQVFDGKHSVETENQIMKDLINQKYDAILLEATDAAAVATVVREAEEAGIPVININGDVDVPHAGLVAMIDYEAGVLVAEEMAKALSGKEGNLAIIQAPPGAARGIRVETGFRDTVANYPNLKIVDAQDGEWLTEKGNIVMRDMLTKYDKLDGVFCINDAMAEGASQAAEAAGRLQDIMIWGADGEKKALEYIEQGKMSGTIYTDCQNQGATAAKLALYLVASGLDSSILTETPVIKVTPIVATKDTVGNISESIRW